MDLPDHWEHGSEFHWLSYQSSPTMLAPWGDSGVLFGSGRDAFRALLSYGQTSCGWRRLWIPSYFCQEVVASFLSTGIEVAAYPVGPANITLEVDLGGVRQGDVLLSVNFFGLDTAPSINQVDRDCVVIIEDHTHDPWSDWAWTSDADWCIASIRKVLPVPDGGVLWSPSRHSLPPAVPVTSERRCASLEKFVAMVVKGLYLEGYPVQKETFHRLAISGEKHIASGQVSGMSEWTTDLLLTFPVEAWRKQRRLNHRKLSAALAGVPWLKVLQPERDSSICPFSGILVFDSPGRRAYVREKLIASCVYPAILWPLDTPVVKDIPQEHVDFSRRMLSIHCDMRYNERDMEHVASLIRGAGGGIWLLSNCSQ